VIILLSNDPRSLTIDAANSPFVVPAPRVEKARSEKVVLLLRAIVAYLSASTQENLAPILVTRHSGTAASIVSPRAGPVLPGPLSLEWSPGRAGSVTVAVLSAGGEVLLRRGGVTTNTLSYPDAAPSLVPGERYLIRVQTHPDSAALETWFEIVGSERAAEAHRDMADLARLVSPTVPVSTVVLLKAGYLARQGFLHDARALLIAALDRAPREAALHLLLGHVYTETGLPELATESYRAASVLLANSGRMPVPR
jgi:hypothetical protein